MSVGTFPILSLIIFLPLVGAVLVAVLPPLFFRGNQDRAARWIALAAALATWVLSLELLIGFSPGRPGFLYDEVVDWIPLFGIQYKLGVDGLSLVLVVLTTTLSWISILASFGPIRNRVKEYMISFLILEVGMNGVFLALDLFLFYVFWEVVLVPMYLIIGIWGGANRLYATIKFVLFTLVGSLLMLVAILAVAFTFQTATGAWAGAFDYEQLRLFAAGGGFSEPFQLFAFLAFFLAFAIIYGAIVALRQPDLKRLVAYSSVSHMGFVTLGIFVFTTQGMQGAILQMVNHGLITGALFLLVGIIYERTHDRAIAKMGGLAGPVPVFAATLGFFVLASGGLPGLSGFVGEFLVLVGTFAYNPLVAGVATLAMILAAAYLLWMFQRVVFGELSDFLRGLGGHLTDMEPVEVLTLAPLATLVVIFGLFPGLVLDLVAGSVGSLVPGAAEATTTLVLR